MADLSPAEFAAEMKIHVETVKRGLRAGTIQGYRIGKLWRIPAEVVEGIRKSGIAVPESSHRDEPAHQAATTAEDILATAADQDRETWLRHDPQAAIALLRSLREGDPQEQRDTLSRLAQSVDEDRAGQRRPFAEDAPE